MVIYRRRERWHVAHQFGDAAGGLLVGSHESLSHHERSGRREVARGKREEVRVRAVAGRQSCRQCVRRGRQSEATAQGKQAARAGRRVEVREGAARSAIRPTRLFVAHSAVPVAHRQRHYMLRAGENESMSRRSPPRPVAPRASHRYAAPVVCSTTRAVAAASTRRSPTSTVRQRSARVRMAWKVTPAQLPRYFSERCRLATMLRRMRGGVTASCFRYYARRLTANIRRRSSRCPER